MSGSQTKIVGRNVYYRGCRIAVLLEDEGVPFSIIEDFKEALLEVEDSKLESLRKKLFEQETEICEQASMIEALSDERDGIKDRLMRITCDAGKLGDLATQVKELAGRVQLYARDH